MINFSERLVKERSRLGLSQTAFGELASVTKLTQFNYEKGNRNPDASYLIAVSEAGVDVNYLLTGERAVTQAKLKEEINAELRYLADAYEAIDTALHEADKYLAPNRKRQAAEALYLAFKGGEIQDLGRGANLLLSAA